jgi:hypothetical protein
MALSMSEPDSRPLPPLPVEGGSWELDETAWEWVRGGELIPAHSTDYLVEPEVTGDKPLAIPLPADPAPSLAS